MANELHRLPTAGEIESENNEYCSLDISDLDILSDHISIPVSDRGIFELAPVLTAGFQVHNDNHHHNSTPQDGNGNNNDVTHHIDLEFPVAEADVDPANVPTSVSPENLAIAQWVVALLTLSLVISTVLYKPARGVVFGRNKEAYYLTLAAIFVAGVVEVFTAMWISRSRNANRRRFSFGRVVLCASIGPLVAIIGISGFAFIRG